MLLIFSRLFMLNLFDSELCSMVCFLVCECMGFGVGGLCGCLMCLFWCSVLILLMLVWNMLVFFVVLCVVVLVCWCLVLCVFVLCLSWLCRLVRLVRLSLLVGEEVCFMVKGRCVYWMECLLII